MNFTFPDYLENIDWQSKMDESEESDKPLLLAEGRLAIALEHFGKHVTAEKYAWLIIWTRTYQAILETKVLKNSQLTYSIDLLERSLSDTQRILFTIIEPFKWDQPEDVVMRQVHTTLKDYTTWCLWKDYSGNERLLKVNTLDKIFDPEPTKAFKADIKSQELFPYVEELETDKDILNKERIEFAKSFYLDNERISRLVSEFGLKNTWAELNKEWYKSFSEFIDSNKSSVKKELKAFDLDFAYSHYEQNSNIAHGSTAKGYLFHHEERVYPILIRPENEIERKIKSLADRALQIATLLTAICQKSDWK